jgi:hypothetical protein
VESQDGIALKQGHGWRKDMGGLTGRTSQAGPAHDALHRFAVKIRLAGCVSKRDVRSVTPRAAGPTLG